MPRGGELSQEGPDHLVGRAGPSRIAFLGQHMELNQKLF